MKSYKELMNQAVRQSNVLRELTQEESAALKECILGIFKDVSSVCVKHGLTYMLAGGSCLGAVRHKGFIPWDDDLDMMMPRGDYEELLLLLEDGILGDEYSFRYPGGCQDSPAMFLKVYRNDTVLVDLLDGENCPYPQKVFIDVFPLDGVPSSSWARKLKGYVADGLRFAANTVSERREWSQKQNDFYSQNISVRRLARRRQILGKVLSVIPHKRWITWFDRFVRESNMAEFVGIPTGRKHYCGEIFKREVYFPTDKGLFEGINVPLPGNWDAYLCNLYKNYMQLPPLEKRERHFFVNLEIPGGSC